MHLLTHALAGWCVGNCVAGSFRERAFCIGLALLPDIDGVAIVGGVHAFYEYHHVVAHNAIIAVLASGLAAMYSTRRIGAMVLYCAVVHMHLVMDLFGSGPGWGIAYFWPFAQAEFAVRHGWAIDAWQNFAVLGIFVVWSCVIVVCWRRTPLECLAPRIDDVLLSILRRPRSRPLAEGEAPLRQ